MTIDDFDVNEITDKLAVKEESEEISPLAASGHDDHGTGAHDDFGGGGFPHDDFSPGHDDFHDDTIICC